MVSQHTVHAAFLEDQVIWNYVKFLGQNAKSDLQNRPFCTKDAKIYINFLQIQLPFKIP